MRREIKSLSHFLESPLRGESKGEGGARKQEASTHTTSHLIAHHQTSPYFFSPLDHVDHRSHLFRRLYLGPQPRYKPSAASALSPTPLATDRCPPIIGSHHGPPLRRPFSTPARNQLFYAASSLFKAFAE
jgi:hypothetical protein